jgi:(E)-4-hydroxy-3-methylbut-2-enyl-diphosphate synthase
MNPAEYISGVVRIGNLPLGGMNPIRIQSMTSTNTLDTDSTVSQAIRMIQAGCEYVRITAQGVKEATNLAVIKKELTGKGFKTPLIADIHYNPKAAEVAAAIVEKVRINPGNYVDRKKGKIYFTDPEYAEEIDRIRERIQPLIGICRRHGTVLRIGSNHGSLSERILFRYGDTPEGMVESALEFAAICEDFGFRDIVLSMKASNVKVMVQANRLLAARLIETGRNYPIHLGVTEAGDGEDGRIKSAAGIGTLLGEGIGDTIRVSLTEDPEFEIPVAKAIISRYHEDGRRKKIMAPEHSFYDPFAYSRRNTRHVGKIGNGQVPVVVADDDGSLSEGNAGENDLLPDYVFSTQSGKLQSVAGSKVSQGISSTQVGFVRYDSLVEIMKDPLPSDDHRLIVLTHKADQPVTELKKMIGYLSETKLHQPVVVMQDFSGLSAQEMLLQASSGFAGLLVDGLADGIWIRHSEMDIRHISRLAFGILQATGSRISKTEYIACPSCGRTLFGIQETLKKIKSRTSHLTGLRIGVMGCCVNGPGEMADADYGYVGGGKGKITLYRKHQIVKAGIPEEEAVEALISLIKKNDDWK